MEARRILSVGGAITKVVTRTSGEATLSIRNSVDTIGVRQLSMGVSPCREAPQSRIVDVGSLFCGL